jgi:hypothetical protein
MNTNLPLRRWALASMALLVFDACRKEIALSVNTTVSATAKTPVAGSDLVITPAGLMPQSNVHYIREGNFISVENGRIQQFEAASGRMVADFGEVKITPAHQAPEAYWAAETLESYGVTDPSTMYPPNTDIAFTGIQILEGSTNASIDWLTAQDVSGSAQQAVVVSDASPGGIVDIYFR